MILCHRGIQNYYPENTLGSINEALTSDKYDGVELDINLTKDNKWIIKTDHKKFTSQYVICCTGSRDRKNPHLPKFKNEKIYQGKIVHTQAWGNTDFKDKDVTIVGSGCTAITMAPSIIKEAKNYFITTILLQIKEAKNI